MRIKIYCMLIVCIVFVVSDGFAQGSGENQKSDFLYGFLQGTYDLIGKLPDSDKIYSGKVILKKKGNIMEVTRIIKGDRILGSGRIESATADSIKVLRVRFIEKNIRYEATYLISSDLDNYGRLSGYLYLQKGGTKIPGLEALFIHRNADDKIVRGKP